MTTSRENRKQKALVAIANGATKASAARSAGINRKTIYRWLDADPDFATEFETAWAAGAKQRDYLTWLNHPFRGLRPPTGRGTRSRPRFSR